MTSAEDMDLYLPIRPGSDFELAWALRGLAKGIEPDPSVDGAASRGAYRRAVPEV